MLTDAASSPETSNIRISLESKIGLKKWLDLDPGNVLSLRNSGTKYISNNMPRQIQNVSICLSNASAKKTSRGLIETFVYLVGNGFGIS